MNKSCYLVKIWTVQRRVHCVLWLEELYSVMCVRREYCRVYNEESLHRNNIHQWNLQPRESGNFLDREGWMEDMTTTIAGHNAFRLLSGREYVKQRVECVHISYFDDLKVDQRLYSLLYLIP